MYRHAIAAILILATIAPAAPSDDAARAFADGNSLLAKADFDGALQAFSKAARTDTENQLYRQHYAILRQIIRLREAIQKEKDPNRWTQMAQALRSFYHAYEIYGEALPLDQEMYKRSPGPETAAMLAETRLAMDHNADAAKLLTSLPKNQTTPRTNVLLGIALARQNRIDDAKSVADKAAIDQNTTPQLCYEVARLRALTGDNKGATDALIRLCERTPPSRLDALKADVKECKDFAALASSADFRNALQTASKIQESGCSAGPGCGNCPMRAGSDSAGCNQPCTK